MALEFTNIPDRNGPAVYLFGDGTSFIDDQVKQLGVEIDNLTQAETQVVYLDPLRDDGLKVKEFYGLLTFPAVLIVMDDDTVPMSWNGQLPRTEEVTYALSQISGSMRSS